MRSHPRFDPRSVFFVPVRQERKEMLAAVFIIFLALWILGVATSCMFGGFIHILLALAVVTGLIRFIQDLRVAS